jgi:acyl-CoA reductase-like NAD-dependent aldehyde dehydrogenase
VQPVLGPLDDFRGLPPGVVNLVHGPGDPTGSALAAHPGIDMVSFTGSTATERQIMTAAAGTLKRVPLQCSGKAPSLVFADCELEKALERSPGARFSRAASPAPRPRASSSSARSTRSSSHDWRPSRR